MKHKIHILTAILLWSITAWSQEYSVDKRISSANGLSNDLVSVLALDGEGYVWAATESGVNRIAGSSMKEIHTSDNRQMITDILYHKPTNQMLIGSENGLFIYDCKKRAIRNTDEKTGIEKVGIGALIPAHDNGVWLVYVYGKVQHWNCDGSQPTTLPIKQMIGSHCGLDDGKGHLYLGHWHEGMSMINLKDGKMTTFMHKQGDATSLPGNNVRKIYQDSQGRIWVGTDHGLALFHPANGTFTKVVKETDTYDDNVYDILEMHDGTLWVATDMGGVLVVNLKQLLGNETKLHFDPITVRLSSINTRSILQDEYDNIWIGNHSTGVDFISAQKQPFLLIDYYDKNLRRKPVYAFAQENDTRFWIGSEDELSVWENNQMKGSWAIQSKMRREHSYSRSMMCDHFGHVWMGMEDEGVIVFDKVSNTFKRIDIGLEAPDIHSFMEDKDGRMWIGSQQGVFSYKDGTVRYETEINRITQNGPVTGLMMLNDEEMLVATLGGGLFVINMQTKKSINLQKEGGLPSGKVNQIMADSQKGLWVATYEGLAFVEDPAHLKGVTIYNKKQGIDDNHIRALQQDAAGRIWMSTFSGISCFDRKAGKFYNYHQFGQHHLGGFSIGASMASANGNIYFGAANGACYFNPLNFNHIQTSNVQIVACEAYNPTGSNTEIIQMPVEPNGNIRTNYKQNTLRLIFTIRNYAQTGREEYSYMMKGLSNKWYYVGSDQDVVFRSMPPGHYTFILRAKLLGQDWDEASETQIHIYIAPPFWQTWWAYLFYFLSIVALVAFIFRSYRRKLTLSNSLEMEKKENLQKQELNEERLRFFTNVTHELRTPLTLILGPLEDLMNDRNLPQNSKRRVSMIHKSAEQLRNLISEILEFRKTQTQNRRLTVAKGDLGHFVEEICINFKELYHHQNVQFSYDIASNLPQVYFDSEVINTIMNNFLSNAIKYTEQGTICVTVKESENQIVIEVADTGYGIATEALPHIFERYYQAKGSHQASGTGIGLALVKSLADLHEALLSVESEEGKGSRFALSLDIDKDYPNALHKEDKQEKAPKDKNDTEQDTETEDFMQKLLIVEDNADIRQYISDSFGEDFHILQAENGMEGVKQAKEQIPDIIVSDIMMPKLNGIQLTKQLKEDVRTCHIPIILLTAKVTDEDKQEGYESGADSYLTKPFTAKLLASRIKNLLANRRRIAEQLAAEDIVTGASKKNDDDKENVPQLNRLDKAFIEKLNTLINENIMHEDIDMAFVTDKMGMSHSTFYRKVKALTGLTAKEYIRKKRLLHSYHLLESGDYNVTEAAMMTGFNQMAHFRETFKKEFGVNPSDVMKSKQTRKEKTNKTQ